MNNENNFINDKLFDRDTILKDFIKLEAMFKNYSEIKKHPCKVYPFLTTSLSEVLCFGTDLEVLDSALDTISKIINYITTSDNFGTVDSALIVQLILNANEIRRMRNSLQDSNENKE